VPSHRPGRLGARWTPAAGPGRIVEIGPLAVADAAVRRCLAGQRRIRVVDLGHASGGGLDGRRVIAGQVRVVRSRQPPPGGFDLAGGGTALDTEDEMGVAFRHVPSVVARHRCPALDSRPSVPSPTDMGLVRRAGLAAAVAAAPLGLAYRFALAYRARAGYPRQHPPQLTPADLGLPFEATTVRSGDLDLAAWFIPARGGQPGPGVALVHGWESARDRTLPNVAFLHAAGFHCLTIDVRGHGANPAETLPISAGEFGLDALATFEALIERPEVTVGAIVGHSMGAIGAILAGAADPRVAAVVATSGPADPYRLTRQTFHLANLPIPDPIAYPLAWLTTRVYLAPRGHTVADISATQAIARYRGPILLAHGDADQVVPPAHLRRLAAAAHASRPAADPAPIETLVVPGGQHSWLYEDPVYRATVARFLATALGGPLTPDEAATIAAATPAERIPDGESRFAAVAETQGGFRTLAKVALPGATRPPVTQAGGAEPGVPAAADEPGLG
jgi:alpha-beta hydrolase superfamily lysophospholipase